jgi:protein CWC15
LKAEKLYYAKSKMGKVGGVVANPLDVDSDISDDEEEMIVPSEKALGKRRVAESEDEDSGSDSSDQDDTEDLLRELEKIKAERAAERERIEREKM